jgi:hypothetical protein
MVQRLGTCPLLSWTGIDQHAPHQEIDVDSDLWHWALALVGSSRDWPRLIAEQRGLL